MYSSRPSTFMSGNARERVRRGLRFGRRLRVRDRSKIKTAGRSLSLTPYLALNPVPYLNLTLNPSLLAPELSRRAPDIRRPFVERLVRGQTHFEHEAAQPQAVAVLQDRLAHLLIIDEDAVQTVHVED